MQTTIYKVFTVSKDHLALLKEMNVSWNDCEFGAPTINPKRPYGNSDVSELDTALAKIKEEITTSEA